MVELLNPVVGCCHYFVPGLQLPLQLQSITTSKQRRHLSGDEIHYPNVTSQYFATTLAFNASDGGVPLRRSP